ncbi:MAG: hypothetical protein Rubg2KO_10040 [Rubricoccaceae bacterium]
MRRAFLLLSLGLGLVALLAGAVAALAYGADATREGELEIDGIRQPVVLSWGTDGSPTIEAASLPDLALGLGYAHAADHAWTLALWRQAGRGGLGAWFGAQMRPMDRHARALGLDALAQETYRSLDGGTRALLDAYTAGVNAALLQPGIAKGDAFVLTDVEPEAWRPWDALLVERLVAYLATPAPATDSVWTQAARRDSSLHPFLTADSTFRTVLGIGGTDGARAFTAPAETGQAFVAHQPAGASALDLFAPVTLRLNGQTVAATSIPGTLSFPMGWTGTTGWSVFLTSSLRLEAFVGQPPPSIHSRIVERNGDEVLLSIPRDTSGLVLTLSSPTLASSTDSSTVPTGWRLRWSGFRPGTDVPAFQSLLTTDASPTFSLLRGEGLRVRPGDTSLLGSPRVGLRTSTTLFAGATLRARRAGAVLAWMASQPDSTRTPFSASALARHDASLWAAQTLPPLLRALGNRDSLDRELDAPYAFLKGWTYRYTPDAIAPSILETWLASHEAYTGHVPDPTDSLDVMLLPHTLRIARASLRDTYGPKATAWQWGHLQGRFTQPIFDDRRDRAITNRFPSPTDGTGGHPTTLFPGPAWSAAAPRPGTGEGPATWSAWAVIGQPRLTVRTPTARIASPQPDRFGPAIFSLGDGIPAERPRLTLVSPS